MKAVDVICMNGGTGDTSYTKNSLLQKEVLQITKSVREQAITALCGSKWATTLCLADLGCSSGPNTLLVVSEFIRIAHNTYKNHGRPSPEFQVYLSDLPLNDFNTVFRSLQSFLEELREEIGSDLGPCFIAGVPGSFYGRLFPARCLHFVHASYCLSFLSEVPKGVGNCNGRNIYLTRSSPPSVIKAHHEQFQRDFSVFLKSRSEELVGDGRMVLTIMGRESDDPTSQESGGYAWELTATALNQLVSEGLIEEKKLISFNIPFYTPSAAEIRPRSPKKAPSLLTSWRFP